MHNFGLRWREKSGVHLKKISDILNDYSPLKFIKSVMKVAFTETVKLWQRKIMSFVNDFKKCTIFWDITLRSPFEVNWRFGGIYHLHFLVRRISRRRNQPEIRWQAEVLLTTYFHAGFLFGLLFSPENGADVFLRNVDWLSTDCTALYPRKSTLHNYHCENLKSYNFRKTHK
jgi:hypothetical protein